MSKWNKRMAFHYSNEEIYDEDYILHRGQITRYDYQKVNLKKINLEDNETIYSSRVTESEKYTIIYHGIIDKETKLGKRFIFQFYSKEGEYITENSLVGSMVNQAILDGTSSGNVGSDELRVGDVNFWFDDKTTKFGYMKGRKNA